MSLTYQLIRSRRRSVSLIVETDGQVTVRAPLRLPQAAIDAFVQERAGWVRQKQAELVRQAERCGRPPGMARHFAAGELQPFLGQVYPLVLVDTRRPALDFDNAFLLAKSAQPKAAQVFESWYKAQARSWFTRRTAELARQHGFSYRNLRLSSARTRWGSCSPAGVINLTWRLILAPPAVIDYVILHELAHLKERNHSTRFWALVGSLMPDYKTQRHWLKANSACLSWP